MKRTNGTLARRARPLFVVATLVCSVALAFTPGVPAVIALSPDPSAPADPGQSPAPDPTPAPTPDPTPSPKPDPTAAPTPDPTPDPTAAPTPDPTAAPTPDPTATPDRTATPDPTATPAGDPSSAPSADPGATSTPEPSGAPTPEPTATPTPAPTLPPAGPRALTLDATKGQHATVADDPAFHLAAFTVETWLRRAAPKTDDPVGMSGAPTATGTGSPGTGGLDSAIPLVTRGDGRDAAGRLDWFLGLDARTGVLVADLQDNVDGSNHPITGTTVLEDGTWYHAAATYDGTTWRLFLNGRLEAERATGEILPETSGTSPVGLGTALSGDGSVARGSFDGVLEETRVWSTARTAAEIRHDLDRPVAADAPHLVASWSIDEGGGTTLADGSDAHHDATLVGEPGWIDSPIPDDTIPAAPDSLAADGGATTIALAWSPVGATDLAGYNVYRSATSPVATDGEPLNGPIPVEGAAYVDDAVTAGTAYYYAVTAVDAYANESTASAEASATPGASGGTDPGTTPTPDPTVADVGLTLTSDAPVEGRHRLDPGAALTVSLGLTTPTDLPTARLGLAVPEGWTVADADGGTLDSGRARLTWDLAAIPAGTTIGHAVRLLAPSVSPVDGGPSVESTFAASLEQTDLTTDGPALTVLVAPRVVVEHLALARIDPGTLDATNLPIDTPITDQERFETFRVRFQLRNADDLPITLAPRLEYRSATGTDFQPLPSLDGERGVPFYVSREWTPIGAAGGTKLGPIEAPIDAGSLEVDDRDGADQAAVVGDHSMGLNPIAGLTLPGRSYTEVEFSVRATADADYLATYAFRVTDSGGPIAQAVEASVTLGSRPTIDGLGAMRQGIPVPSPVGRSGSGGVAYGLTPPDVATGPSDGSGVAAVATAGNAPRYALAMAVNPASGSTAAPPAAPLDSTHGPYSLGTSACAACHTSHSSSGTNLLKTSSQSAMCFNCHKSGGDASSLDVQAQYTDPSVPQNDPATRTYYRHDALAPDSGHTLATDNEFGGVSNRHSECADCHSPHAADSTASVQTPDGWTASGRLGRISGVSVVNSTTPGDPPTYTFIDGKTDPITFEYQLCFKCHSGFTTLDLDSNAAFPESRYVLDKGVEFNPNNQSFHPIEARGTNGTDAMAASLAGPSTFKQWNFSTDSTIRCENCHGDSRKYDTTLPAPGGAATRAGDDLAPHANQPATSGPAVPGILLQSYRYLSLKPKSEDYQASDFALCFTCHAEAPFKDTTGDPLQTDTNFPYHGLHVSKFKDGPDRTDIDAAGDGGGLAICAECHFRIHSTTYATGGQGSYQRLVNFAPNVTDGTDPSLPVGVDAWDQSAMTCSVTCHGYQHLATGY